LEKEKGVFFFQLKNKPKRGEFFGIKGLFFKKKKKKAFSRGAFFFSLFSFFLGGI